MSEENFCTQYLTEFDESTRCFFQQDLIHGCVDLELEFISSLEDRALAPHDIMKKDKFLYTLEPIEYFYNAAE